MVDIVLPELGEGVAKATVACWHVKAGDHVEQGQDVCEVVTDKATFNIESPVKGVIESVNIIEGKDATIGAVLGVIK